MPKAIAGGTSRRVLDKQDRSASPQRFFEPKKRMMFVALNVELYEVDCGDTVLGNQVIGTDEGTLS